MCSRSLLPLMAFLLCSSIALAGDNSYALDVDRLYDHAGERSQLQQNAHELMRYLDSGVETRGYIDPQDYRLGIDELHRRGPTAPDPQASAGWVNKLGQEFRSLEPHFLIRREYITGPYHGRPDSFMFGYPGVAPAPHILEPRASSPERTVTDAEPEESDADA
jgi:hypothetical protein